MSTNFYLADPRIMSQEEIELARRFDENALLCKRSNAIEEPAYFKGVEGMFYSLAVDLTSLLSLPQNTRLISDNSSLGITTIGDLISSLKDKDAIVQIPSESTARSYQSIYRWRKKRQHVPGLENVAPEIRNIDSLMELNLKQPDTMDWIRRYLGIEDTDDFCPN